MNDILILTKLLQWSIVNCDVKCQKVAQMAKKSPKPPDFMTKSKNYLQNLYGVLLGAEIQLIELYPEV